MLGHLLDMLALFPSQGWLALGIPTGSLHSVSGPRDASLPFPLGRERYTLFMNPHCANHHGKMLDVNSFDLPNTSTDPT